MKDQTSQVTGLLREIVRGDSGAVHRLFPLVYDELRALARGYMRSERPDHTLQSTALVHDAYVRLVGESAVQWEGRAHFMRIAARAMRQVLVEHARRRGALKRGAGAKRVTLAEAELEAPSDDYLVALDEALPLLEERDPQAARIVELRFFGGLTVEETAENIGVSARTVKRDWRVAKGWLHQQIMRENDT